MMKIKDIILADANATNSMIAASMMMTIIAIMIAIGMIVMMNIAVL